MAPVRNARALFQAYVKAGGYVVPGQTTVYDDKATIDIDKVALDGGFVLKTLVLSIEPYLIPRMREATPLVPVVIGQPLNSFGVGVVVRSENPKVKVGDHIFGMINHEEYSLHKDVVPPSMVIANEHKLSWTAYLGILGLPGQTAFYGWKEFSKAKKGETVFVTSGGGAVGSMVIQLAKLEGLKVIATAGSDEKVDFMKSIGADVAFNYKTTDTAEILAKEGPIDIYWDNIGGPILDQALAAANTHARFIECGMASGYSEGFKPISNLFNVITKAISMHGVNIPLLAPKYFMEFFTTVPALVASGELKYSEEVTDGLESVGDVILGLQKGENKAKSVVKVADN